MPQRTELSGPRLDLRRMGAGDEALYCALYCDEGVMRHIGSPLSEVAARRAFAATLRINASCSWVPSYWAIVERQSSARIGLAGLVCGASKEDAELGILILPGWQGRGYAKDALSMLMGQACSATSLNRLHARHAAANGAMFRVMTQLGFARKFTAEETPLALHWQLYCQEDPRAG